MVSSTLRPRLQSYTHRNSFGILPIGFKYRKTNTPHLNESFVAKIVSKCSSSCRARTYITTILRLKYLCCNSLFGSAISTSFVFYSQYTQRMPSYSHLFSQSNIRNSSVSHLNKCTGNHPAWYSLFNHTRSVPSPIIAWSTTTSLARHSSNSKSREAISLSKPYPSLSLLVGRCWTLGQGKLHIVFEVFSMCWNRKWRRTGGMAVKECNGKNAMERDVGKLCRGREVVVG